MYLCVLVYANVSPSCVHVALWECAVCMLVSPDCFTLEAGGLTHSKRVVLLDLLQTLLSHLT